MRGHIEFGDQKHASVLGVLPQGAHSLLGVDEQRSVVRERALLRQFRVELRLYREGLVVLECACVKDWSPVRRVPCAVTVMCMCKTFSLFMLMASIVCSMKLTG